MSDPAELSFEELEDEVARWAAHVNAGTCRWLELLGELDHRGEWEEGSGVGSCAEWLAWRCALLPRAAREHVRVARRLPELPLIHEAFASGELSYSKVRALTRVADAESEAELLELARAMTAAQLERAVGAYRRVTLREANELHDHANVSVFWDEDGALVIRGRLAPEDGAVFLRALESARDSLWEQQRGSAEPQARPTNADALVALSDAALASGAGRNGGERYQVVLNVDPDGAFSLGDGPVVASETAKRIACDSSLVRNSRKTRTIPPSLRRALRTRDRGCRFPGCNNHRFVDAHHIHHWADGGQTTAANLVLLCRRHHRHLHEGGYTIDHHFQFYDPWGRRVPDVPASPPGRPTPLAERAVASGDNDPMDLDLAVDILLTMSRRQVWPAMAVW